MGLICVLVASSRKAACRFFPSTRYSGPSAGKLATQLSQVPGKPWRQGPLSQKLDLETVTLGTDPHPLTSVWPWDGYLRSTNLH